MAEQPTGGMGVETIELNELIQETRKSLMSAIPDLDIYTIGDVWWHASMYIADALSRGKGVTILGLGTFTLNKVSGKAVPTFVLSERFANRNDCKANAPHIEGNTPVSNLNLTFIASQAELNKSEVEACIREVLMVMTRKLDDPRGVALEFHGIGRLSVKRRKVRFTFFRMFLNNPKPLVGRPPTRSNLSSRCGTAGVFGAGSRPVSRSQSRGGARGATPLLFANRPGLPKKIGWQSGMTDNSWLEIVDPEQHPEGSLPYANVSEHGEQRGRNIGAEVWKNTHGGLGSIYENSDDLDAGLLPDQEATVQQGRTRNLNLTADAQRDPDALDTYKFAEKTVDWDTHAGQTLPILDGEMVASKLLNYNLGTTVMPYGSSLTNTERIRGDDGQPKREETMMFDPTRARLGSPQHRPAGPKLDYVAYQQSRPLPELGYTDTMRETDRVSDESFMRTQKTKAFRAAALEKTLAKDAREIAKRTAQFNISTHNARLMSAPTRSSAEPGGTDLLFARPDTAREAIRHKNKEVAEFVTGQHSATESQKPRQEKEQKDLERLVADCAKEQHMATETEAFKRRKAYQMWNRQQLDRQVREGQEKAQAEYEADLREYPITAPHFHPELDAVGFEMERRRAAQEALRANKAIELANLQKAKDGENARVEEGRRMLAQTKLDAQAENAEGVEQRKAMCAKITYSLAVGHQEKMARDQDDRLYQLAPSKLNAIEQLDKYDLFDRIPTVPNIPFAGRTTNVVNGKTMKGTEVIC